LIFFLSFAGPVVTGVIWGVIYYFSNQKGLIFNEEDEPVLVEYARSFFPIVLIVLLLRSFIAEPFAFLPDQ